MIPTAEHQSNILRRALTDAERFDRTLAQAIGKRLTYAELTGKDLVLR